ncbi:MAG: hypothetical protein IH598_09535 [Bacteroidales bacterium]|nr:hypothetical protein [Bacteroidales bacterium]
MKDKAKKSSVSDKYSSSASELIKKKELENRALKKILNFLEQEKDDQKQDNQHNSHNQ